MSKKIFWILFTRCSHFELCWNQKLTSGKFSSLVYKMFNATFCFAWNILKRWIFGCYTDYNREREREQEIYLYAWRNRSTGWLMHNVSTVCFTLVIHLYIFSRCVFFYTGIAIVHYSRPVHATKKDYWNLIYLIPFAKNVSAKNTRTLFKKRIDESMEFSMFSTSDSPVLLLWK